MDLRGFDPDTLEILEGYDWPGNVRELQGVVKQAMLNASGHILYSEFLPEQLLKRGASPPAPSAEVGDFDLTALIEARLRDASGHVYEEVIAAVERLLLARVLRQTRGHQSQASELLGLNRATLRHKLRTLGLAVDKILIDEEEKES